MVGESCGGCLCYLTVYSTALGEDLRNQQPSQAALSPAVYF
jgi:hypothetical protein